MKNKVWISLLAVGLLSACMTTYRGQVVREVAFKADGGKTITLPVARGGAVPSENEDYKIEVAGYMGTLQKGNPADSTFTLNFSFRSKKNKELEYVRVEYVDPSGKLTPVVQDDAPTLKNGDWIGKSAALAATKELSPWLYDGSDSTFLFKFTIKARNENPVEMYQPSLFDKGTKALYLQVMGVRA